MYNPSAERRYRFSIPRILLCGILLTVLVAACLYVYYTAFEFFHARLLENQSKTLAWFCEQLGYSLPFIIICLFHLLVYHKHDRKDGAARREMFWEIVMVTILTYAVLLPYLGKISEALYINALAAGETIPETDVDVEITLLMELHEWFIRLTIPLGVLMAFHGLRARREIRYPETELPVEPPMTVEEYEARKAALRAAEQASETAAEEEGLHTVEESAAQAPKETAHE